MEKQQSSAQGDHTFPRNNEGITVIVLPSINSHSFHTIFRCHPLSLKGKDCEQVSCKDNTVQFSENNHSSGTQADP